MKKASYNYHNASAMVLMLVVAATFVSASKGSSLMSETVDDEYYLSLDDNNNNNSDSISRRVLIGFNGQLTLLQPATFDADKAACMNCRPGIQYCCPYPPSNSIHPTCYQSAYCGRMNS